MPTTSSGGEKGCRLLKVAQVVGSPVGGVMSCVMNYFRNLDHTKVQCDFFTYGPSVYDEEIKRLGGNVYHFANVFKFWKSVPQLKKYFLQNGYDIVHAHMTTRSAFILKAAKQAKVPVRICHAHSTSHPAEGLGFVVKGLLKPFARKYATHYAGCCTFSNLWLFGKKGKDAFVVRNAIDATKFKAAEAPLSSVKTIGFVGRFVFQKNVGFLMKTFSRLCKLRSDVRLVLVGDGHDKKKLQRQAKKCCGQVEFYPETSQIEGFYPLFDVFVLPSRYEGFPLVAVEAQACGVKCLLSNKITSDIDVGGDVRQLPIKDPKAWARELNKMLDQPGADAINLQQMGFDIATEAPKLVEYYQEIIKATD